MFSVGVSSCLQSQSGLVMQLLFAFATPQLVNEGTLSGIIKHTDHYSLG